MGERPHLGIGSALISLRQRSERTEGTRAFPTRIGPMWIVNDAQADSTIDASMGCAYAERSWTRRPE